jgi:hypothetical protein
MSSTHVLRHNLLPRSPDVSLLNISSAQCWANCPSVISNHTLILNHHHHHHHHLAPSPILLEFLYMDELSLPKPNVTQSVKRGRTFPTFPQPLDLPPLITTNAKRELEDENIRLVGIFPFVLPFCRSAYIRSFSSTFMSSHQIDAYMMFYYSVVKPSLSSANLTRFTPRIRPSSQSPSQSNKNL